MAQAYNNVQKGLYDGSSFIEVSVNKQSDIRSTENVYVVNYVKQHSYIKLVS